MILQGGEPVAIHHIKKDSLIFIKLSKDIRKLASLDRTPDNAKSATKNTPEDNEATEEAHDDQGLDAAEDNRVVGGKLQGPSHPVFNQGRLDKGAKAC